MTDLLRADIEFPYGGKLLRPGDVFTVESERDTKTLTAIGHATLVERNYVPVVQEGASRAKFMTVDEARKIESQAAPTPESAPPIESVELSGKPPTLHVKSRGRPKGSKNQYKRRDMRAED